MSFKNKSAVHMHTAASRMRYPLISPKPEPASDATGYSDTGNDYATADKANESSLALGKVLKPAIELPAEQKQGE